MFLSHATLNQQIWEQLGFCKYTSLHSNYGMLQRRSLDNNYTQTKDAFINETALRPETGISTTWRNKHNPSLRNFQLLSLQPHIYIMLNKCAQQRTPSPQTSSGPLFIFCWHLHNSPRWLVLCFNRISRMKGTNQTGFSPCHCVK